MPLLPVWAFVPCSVVKFTFTFLDMINCRPTPVHCTVFIQAALACVLIAFFSSTLNVCCASLPVVTVHVALCEVGRHCVGHRNATTLHPQRKHR